MRKQLGEMERKQYRDSFKVFASELPVIAHTSLSPSSTEKSFDENRSLKKRECSHVNDAKKKNDTESDDKNFSIASNVIGNRADEESNAIFEHFNTSDDDNDVDTSFSNISGSGED